MIINTDVNILGGLSDFNLINVFLEDTPASSDAVGEHRSFTARPLQEYRMKQIQQQGIKAIVAHSLEELKDKITLKN
jgi:hypothetical protein